MSSSEDTWQQAWAHRASLLRVARARSISAADAEDAVAEALARSQEDGTVDYDRIGAWLTSVTMRICADRARDRARDPKRVAYQIRLGATVDDHAPGVCDRAEAAWLASHLRTLPERQRRALELRAEGADIATVALNMGTSYKVAEGLLQRARAHMRGVLATSAAWACAVAGLLVGVFRRRGGAPAGAFALAGASLALGAFTFADTPAKAEPPTSIGPVADAPADHHLKAIPAPTPRSVRDGRPPPVATRAPERPEQIQEQAPAADALPTRAPQSITSGKVTVTDRGSSYERPGQDFVESLERCLSGGITISPTLVGCDPQR